MDEEEKRPSGGQFRVVDKRISARSDAPAGTPDTGAAPPPEQPPPAVPPPTTPPPTEPEPEPQSAPAAPDASSAGPAAAESPEPSSGGAEGEPIWTPEQEAEARAYVEQMAQTPSLEWVVQVTSTLANVAGTKLDLGRVADSQLAIDAVAAIVEKLGSRLDQAEAPLRQILAQLQLAYAQRAAQPQPGAAPPQP